MKRPANHSDEEKVGDACDEDVIPEILKGVRLFLHCR
jgi:hypothetical protein